MSTGRFSTVDKFPLADLVFTGQSYTDRLSTTSLVLDWCLMDLGKHWETDLAE